MRGSGYLTADGVFFSLPPSPPSLFSGRASDKSKLEEFTNDFAKELLEYRKMQKERRRSYSR